MDSTKRIEANKKFSTLDIRRLEQATATHRGVLMGIPATGKRITVSGIVIHKVENGRFAKSWNEVDLLGLKMPLESDVK